MSINWSTAELGVTVPGDPPVSLRYFDTHPGTTGRETYTTIIAVHGTGWNANIWLPWIPYLRKDLRVLAFNRRGYEGSSSPHQSSVMRPGDTEAFGRYLVDLLSFMKFAAEQLGVPAKDVRAKTGGIVLLGWATGSSVMVTLLSLLPSLSTMTRSPYDLPGSLRPYFDVLDTHLRSVILYELSQMTVGLPGLETYPEVQGVPREHLGQAFAAWLRGTIPQNKLAVVDNAVDVESHRHDLACWNAGNAEARGEIAERAFKTIPARVGVGLLYCEDTMYSCLNSAKWVRARFFGQGNTLVRVIPGGNHFVMATNPDAFNDAVCELLDGLGVH